MKNNDTFSELILYRNVYKRLTNLSWTLQQSERRFPVGVQGTPESEEQLLKIYKALTYDVLQLAEDLKRIGGAGN